MIGGRQKTDCRMTSPSQAELASGTSISASEVALTTAPISSVFTLPLTRTKVVDRELVLALAGLVEHFSELVDAVCRSAVPHTPRRTHPC